MTSGLQPRAGPARRWIAVGRLATDRPERDPQLMTYRAFLDSFLYPYVDGSTEEVLQENMRRKKLCGNLQKHFTERGQPGAHLALCLRKPGCGRALMLSRTVLILMFCNALQPCCMQEMHCKVCMHAQLGGTIVTLHHPLTMPYPLCSRHCRRRLLLTAGRLCCE